MSTKTIKIAYFIDRLIRGGTELQLVEQIKRLSEKGVQQEVFCLFRSIQHDEIKVACKVHILEVRKLISAQCAFSILYLKKYLKKNNFNIVQTYFFDSTIIGVIAGSLAGGIKKISCRRDLGFWYTTKILFTLRLLNKFTDKILVNSIAVKNSIIKKEKINLKKIILVANGVDIEKFDISEVNKLLIRDKLKIQPQQVCVGIIANMSRKVKRLDLFIKAAGYVSEKIDSVHFLVKGEGHLKKELIAMAHDMNLNSRITFIRSDIRINEVLSVLDIGVLTSDSEGFSNTIMEYMAAGIPVVATNVGGNSDLVQNNKNGFLTKPGDFKDIGKKIYLLAKDPERRQRFGKKGRQVIENYNWETVSAQTIKIYKEQLK